MLGFSNPRSGQKDINIMFLMHQYFWITLAIFEEQNVKNILVKNCPEVFLISLTNSHY